MFSIVESFGNDFLEMFFWKKNQNYRNLKLDSEPLSPKVLGLVLKSLVDVSRNLY